jgi:hypothetical protein
MKKVLLFAAVAEAVTGLVLLVVPALAGRLLLGTELIGVSIPIARVAGIALIALCLACLPGSALPGMLAYSVLATIYLGYVAIHGEWVGPLLWPAVFIHAALTLLLAIGWFKDRQVRGAKCAVIEKAFGTMMRKY